MAPAWRSATRTAAAPSTCCPRTNATRSPARAPSRSDPPASAGLIAHGVTPRRIGPAHKSLPQLAPDAAPASSAQLQVGPREPRSAWLRPGLCGVCGIRADRRRFVVGIAAIYGEGGGSMNARKSVLGAAVMLGALVAFAGLPAGVARAGTGITVPCSGPGGGAAGLAAAITAANAAGGGTIALAPGCTYTLTAAGSSGPLGANGLPIVSTRITIAGAHATITRSSSQQFRILEVDGPGGNLSASALAITGGNASQPGGGVFNNAGALTLNSSAVTGNTTAADPGGILNKAGTAVLNTSRVDHNTSGSGGGIASGPGGDTAPVTGSSLILNGSRVDHNTAAEGGGEALGGGIVNGGTAVLRGSSVDHNSAAGGAGAGVFNHGTMTITGSQITGNTAPADRAGNDGNVGGIVNVNFGIPPSGGSGVLTMTGSTVSGNSASAFGGGLGNAPDSTATITASSA